MQIKAWDASYGANWYQALFGGVAFTQTDIRQVTLGPDIGPGTVIWQSQSGTSPNRFYPLTFVIPEPASAGIMVLGSAVLFLVNRKRSSHLTGNQANRNRL